MSNQQNSSNWKCSSNNNIKSPNWGSSNVSKTGATWGSSNNSPKSNWGGPNNSSKIGNTWGSPNESNNISKIGNTWGSPNESNNSSKNSSKIGNTWGSPNESNNPGWKKSSSNNINTKVSTDNISNKNIWPNPNNPPLYGSKNLGDTSKNNIENIPNDKRYDPFYEKAKQGVNKMRHLVGHVNINNNGGYYPVGNGGSDTSSGMAGTSISGI